MNEDERYLFDLLGYLFVENALMHGGVAVVTGSHKANLPCPKSMTLGQAYQQHVTDLELAKELGG